MSSALKMSCARAGRVRAVKMQCSSTSTSSASMKMKNFQQKAASGIAAAVIGAASLAGSNADALTKEEIDSLTYLQVKGSGIANTCPTIAGGEAGLALGNGSYEMSNFCMEPSTVKVKDEGNFVDTKLMTRLTYTLDQMTGDVAIDGSKFTFKEKDGIDYAPVTVQLPRGERVPFLFTVKQLDATGDISQIKGEFNVPSYRGSSFLDPKGRGGSTGYEFAVALPSAEIGDVDIENVENTKSTKALTGNIVLTVAKSDPSTGEVAGIFESIQPSDTDLGSKAPKDVKIQGLWYGQLSKK